MITFNRTLVYNNAWVDNTRVVFQHLVYVTLFESFLLSSDVGDML